MTDSHQFGAWFGVRFPGPFKEGERIIGSIAPTTVDPEVAAMQKPHEGRSFDITIERIEPEKLFAVRWHPFAIDPILDYSKEPTTLVEFALKEVPGGVSTFHARRSRNTCA
jgi:hypothetical protein